MQREPLTNTPLLPDVELIDPILAGIALLVALPAAWITAIDIMSMTASAFVGAGMLVVLAPLFAIVVYNTIHFASGRRFTAD